MGTQAGRKVAVRCARLTEKQAAADEPSRRTVYVGRATEHACEAVCCEAVWLPWLAAQATVCCRCTAYRQTPLVRRI
jgi:hypothetical protein